MWKVTVKFTETFWSDRWFHSQVAAERYAAGRISVVYGPDGRVVR